MEQSGPPQHAAPYFPRSAPPSQPYTADRQFCLPCRVDFTDKEEFHCHIRSHGTVIKQDLATADLIARGMVDTSGLCS